MVGYIPESLPLLYHISGVGQKFPPKEGISPEIFPSEWKNAEEHSIIKKNRLRRRNGEINMKATLAIMAAGMGPATAERSKPTHWALRRGHYGVFGL